MTNWRFRIGWVNIDESYSIILHLYPFELYKQKPVWFGKKKEQNSWSIYYGLGLVHVRLHGFKFIVEKYGYENGF